MCLNQNRHTQNQQLQYQKYVWYALIFIYPRNMIHMLFSEKICWVTQKYNRGTHSCFTHYTVRVGRIELPSSAWEALILPLNYTRKYPYS